MCGLFGFSGDFENDFNWDKIKILGIANDIRGGDACGLSTAKNTIHFAKKEKKFDDVFENFVLPNKVDNGLKIVLGQTRKSSRLLRDFLGEEYTQPIRMFDNDGNVLSMGMHNGTLKNHEDLIDEFEVPPFIPQVTDDGEIKMVKPNDSMTLLWILSIKKDYSVIKKYDGAATIIWYDMKDEILYLYSGSSLNQYNVELRERPLYMLRQKNSFWFSSLKKPLLHINHEEGAIIEETETNCLYSIKNGEILKIDDSKEFDRSEVKENYSYRQSTYTEEFFPAKTDNTRTSIFKEKKLKVWMLNGKYMLESDEMNGIYHVNKDGYVTISTKSSFCKTGLIVKDGSVIVTSPHFFINGIHINKSEDYNRLTRILKYDNMPKDDFNKELAKAAGYPIKIGSQGEYYYYDNLRDDLELADGIFIMDIVNTTRKFELGYLTGNTFSQDEAFSDKDNDIDEVNNFVDDYANKHDMVECPICNGEGSIGRNWCNHCNGMGYIHKDHANDEVNDDEVNNEIDAAENQAYREILDEIIVTTIHKVMDSLDDAKDELFNYQDDDVAGEFFTVLTRMERILGNKIERTSIKIS